MEPYSQQALQIATRRSRLSYEVAREAGTAALERASGNGIALEEDLSVLSTAALEVKAARMKRQYKKTLDAVGISAESAERQGLGCLPIRLL